MDFENPRQENRLFPENSSCQDGQTPGKTKEKKGGARNLIKAVAVASAIGEVFGCSPDTGIHEKVNIPGHTQTIKEADKGLTDRMEITLRRIVQGQEQAAISSMIDYNKPGEIKIDSRVLMEKRKKFWVNSFMNDSKFRDGYKRMGQWRPYLENIFKKEGLNKAYIYLALIESNFIFRNQSHAGAQGPFQFMPGTAADFKLKVSHDIDERCDPLASAQSGARYLKDLHAEAGTPEGALSAYNAGRRFMLYAKKNGIEANYGNLCKYYEEKINRIKGGVEKIDSYSYKVRGTPGKSAETLEGIAAKTKVDINSILSYNHLKRNAMLEPGQKIRIPLTNQLARKTLFDSTIAPIWENLNYVPRFSAALKLINEGRLDLQDKALTFKNIKCNKSLNSLVKISKKLKVPLSRLRGLNPGIINPNAALREGYPVRI